MFAHGSCTVRLMFAPRIAATAILVMSASLSLFAPAPARATGPFVPPEGCRLEMTVQNRGCSVSQHYRCPSDAPGDQRVTYLGEQGPLHLSRIDSETRWIESADPQTGLVDRLEEESARDHASLTTLLATGRDDFDFWTVSDTGERLRHIGRDELTGEVVDIDGVELEKTRFELVTYDESGQVLMTRRGQQFVSRVHRRFYGGVESAADWTGAVEETDDSPVSFAFPGQPGFASTTPQYDCRMLMTALPRAAGGGA